MAQINRATLRRAIKDVVDGQPVDRAETVERVADQEDVSAETVDDVLDEMERNGFVYLVGDGDAAEVKLP